MKFSVITGILGCLGDRFCLSGYKEEISLEDKLKKIANIKNLDGVELCFNIKGDESSATQVKNLLNKYNLFASGVNAPLVSDKKWKYGSFTSKEKTIRKDAVEIAKQTIDFAEAVGAPLVNLWLGQDGFDYCFQVDYSQQWDYLIEAVRLCADYKPHIKLALEFKPEEPRNRNILDSASTTLLLIQEIQRDNVGITVDVGHVLQEKRNMAQATELVARYEKLFNLHMNDNYSNYDNDMIVGSIHFIEYLELFFILRKIHYDKCLSIDIFPYREDAFRATEECVEYMKALDRMVNSLGYREVNDIIHDTKDATEILKHIRERLFR